MRADETHVLNNLPAGDVRTRNTRMTARAALTLRCTQATLQAPPSHGGDASTTLLLPEQPTLQDCGLHGGGREEQIASSVKQDVLEVFEII